ncbi:Sec1 family protein [Catovirus CTV1]|uniref:Sec1 family protein n=1 Tax=Catovirus CTV1 TaxID=1977631 RepID=A0A1V0SAF7_9VIRU|nr:Sec1 family protein [Catovirus CTV1]
MFAAKKSLSSQVKKYVLSTIHAVVGKESSNILVLDKDTYECITSLFTNNELCEQSIFFAGYLSDTEQPLKISGMKTLCILNPSDENLHSLKKELNCNPRSNEYYIFFTDFLDSETYLKFSQIINKKIKKLSELYVNARFNHDHSFYISDGYCADEKKISNTLFNLALSLNAHPQIIVSKTPKCEKIGNILNQKFVENKDVSNSLSKKNTFFILDRLNDMITPLLTPWSYLAMMHEYFEIKNNIIQVNKEDIYINHDKDKIMNDNRFSNYGTLTENMVIYTEQLKNENDKINNLKDQRNIKKLASESLEYIDFSKNVSKHLNITSLMSTQIKNNDLFSISGYEQDLICGDNTCLDTMFKIIKDIMTKDNIKSNYKIKLCLLYLVRCEFDKIRIENIKKLFMDKTLSLEFNNILQNFMTKFSIYNIVNIPKNKNKISSFISDIFSKQINSKNHLLRHKPPIKKTVEDYLDGKKISDKLMWINHHHQAPHKIENIIIFVRGGVTFEELSYISQLNNNSYANIYLGGDCFLNTEIALRQINLL